MITLIKEPLASADRPGRTIKTMVKGKNPAVNRFLVFYAGPLTGVVFYIAISLYFQFQLVHLKPAQQPVTDIPGTVAQAMQPIPEYSAWLYSIPLAVAAAFVATVCFICLDSLLQRKSKGGHLAVATPDGVRRVS